MTFLTFNTMKFMSIVHICSSTTDQNSVKAKNYLRHDAKLSVVIWNTGVTLKWTLHLTKIPVYWLSIGCNVLSKDFLGNTINDKIIEWCTRYTDQCFSGIQTQLRKKWAKGKMPSYTCEAHNSWQNLYSRADAVHHIHVGLISCIFCTLTSN